VDKTVTKIKELEKRINEVDDRLTNNALLICLMVGLVAFVILLVIFSFVPQGEWECAEWNTTENIARWTYNLTEFTEQEIVVDGVYTFKVDYAEARPVIAGGMYVVYDDTLLLMKYPIYEKVCIKEQFVRDTKR